MFGLRPGTFLSRFALRGYSCGKRQRETLPLRHAKCFVHASPLLAEDFLASRISICHDIDIISRFDRIISMIEE